MKKMKKIITVMIVMIVITSTIYAGGFNSSVFGKGGTFFEKNNQAYNTGIGEKLASLLTTGEIFDLLISIGNFIFASVTIILGIKYIFSGIEGKAQIKDSLLNLVVGIVFFYLASTLKNGFFGIFEDVLGTEESLEPLLSRLYSILIWVADLLAVTGVIIIGLRYMMTSADGKAELKKRMMPVILGILFIYSAMHVIQFIIDISKNIIPT
ncbi:MAG: hypothetical protein PHR25_00080 [Clostridia bacterium]|nr:hypothetical protein [Clostridia bacterium]MDD4375172.1 hypothetical protein [Clostridia bacterium]